MKRSLLIIAALVLLAAAAFCGYGYYRITILPDKQVNEAYEEQIDVFKEIRPQYVDRTDTAVSLSDTHESLSSEIADTDEETGDHVIGWITVAETNIDYPIAQADDNDFYLHNGIDGEYNYDIGCPFLDYRCRSDFGGFNSIVYAHHMTERRMFADVALFKESDFMKSNPTGTLFLPDGAHNVRFFAYLGVSSTSPLYHSVFITDSEKNDYLDYIFSQAVYTEGLRREDIGTDSRLLLLSTCTFEYDEARGVIVGLIE